MVCVSGDAYLTLCGSVWQGSETLTLWQLSATSPGWSLSALTPSSRPARRPLSLLDDESPTDPPSTSGSRPEAAASIDPATALAPNGKASLFYYVHPPAEGSSPEGIPAGQSVGDPFSGPLQHYHDQGRPHKPPPPPGPGTHITHVHALLLVTPPYGFCVLQPHMTGLLRWHGLHPS